MQYYFLLLHSVILYNPRDKITAYIKKKSLPHWLFNLFYRVFLTYFLMLFSTPVHYSLDVYKYLFLIKFKNTVGN